MHEKIVSFFQRGNHRRNRKKKNKLSSKNASQNSDIPTRAVTGDAHIFAEFLCKSINATFKSSMFPNSLKLAVVTPLHKKTEKT